MAALRIGMIAFVEVASFNIGTYVMYLATVHPLLILFADDRAELLNALKRGKISETPETLEAFILHEQIKFFNREI